jgi:hypothetical protein
MRMAYAAKPVACGSSLYSFPVRGAQMGALALSRGVVLGLFASADEWRRAGTKQICEFCSCQLFEMMLIV